MRDALPPAEKGCKGCNNVNGPGASEGVGLIVFTTRSWEKDAVESWERRVAFSITRLCSKSRFYQRTARLSSKSYCSFLKNFLSLLFTFNLQKPIGEVIFR